VNYYESNAFREHMEGRRLKADIEWDELKEKVRRDVEEWAKDKCGMKNREIDEFLNKRIKECTNIR